MKLKEVKSYVKKMGIKLPKGKVAECFYKSLVTDIDPVKYSRYKVMYPQEFPAFMCMITYE